MNLPTENLDERWQALRERTSVPGWKGRRSVAVSGATWDRAHEFVRIVREETGCGVRPFVSASESGSVCLSWGTAPGPVINVELKADGDVEWEVDGPSGYESGEHDRGAVLQRIRDSLCAA